MSDQFNSLSGPVDREVVQKIEHMNISTIQKLHMKILTHCLEILKKISQESNEDFPSEESLKNWCMLESKKIDDDNFYLLLFQQIYAAAIKLKNYSKSIEKRTLDLTLDDLMNLTSESK